MAAEQIAPPPRVRVASYNIHRCVGTDGRRAPERIAAVLAEIDADVIGLQEVDWHDDPDTGIPQPELLAMLSEYRAVAGPNLRDHRGHYGNLLLVRGALGDIHRLDISVPGREPRGAIAARIEAKGLRFRTVVTHFGLSPNERRAQATALAAAVLQGSADPVVLAGDFNAWLPGMPSLRPLRAQARVLGGPASFPAGFPVLALDRLLTRGLAATGPVRAHRSPAARRASDHLPIFADLAAAE
jgi:endonuclease/exonuclease/phosphatase family metal-dependent hydrolase